jgi:anti-sigma-K factor RskA
VDIKAYIDSGVIEAYVMGLASPEEVAELEQLRTGNPEINEAIRSFEEQLEKTAMGQAVPPPSYIKEQLRKKLGPFPAKENAQAKVRSIAPNRPFWKYAAAAAIILLIGSAILNFYLYNRYKKADLAYANLVAETRSLQANNRVINTRLDEMQHSIEWMVNPTVKKIEMPGMGSHTQYTASVYWNTGTKEVYLMPNNLPAAPQGKQYQLWAMVDGKPVDAGMMDSCVVLCRMKTIPRAEAFAITLENTGGSPTPNLNELYVMGKTGS